VLSPSANELEKYSVDQLVLINAINQYVAD